MGREMVWLLLALQVKHFVFDFAIQPRWMHANKGNFGHPGGIVHAWLHGIATGVILSALGFWPLAIPICALEFVAHYVIDWTKMNITRIMGWVPIPKGPYSWPSSEAFWIFLGADQLAHQLCYVAIVAIALQ